MESNVEPWLRGTLTDVDPVRRQVLHALEITAEDIDRWCASLTDAEMEGCPHGLPSVGFHLRHMGRSLDRLLTYAEGRQLAPDQLALLTNEQVPSIRATQTVAEFRMALQEAGLRIRNVDPDRYAQSRAVGRQHLPTTVVGLLIHCAEHTQRHSGQAITTAKIMHSLRGVK
jgi:hypothetical protein